MMEPVMLYHPTAELVTTSQADQPVAKPERDNRGRYLPGHKSKGGRPPRAIELSFLKQMRDSLDADTWQQIIDKAVELAKAGDATARTWLSSYLLGPANGNRLTELCLAELTGTTTVTDRLVSMEFGGSGLASHRRQVIQAAVVEQHGFTAEE